MSDDMQARCDELARMTLAACKRKGLYLAGAESLTGGLLADAFVRIPGASEVFLGSAVTYDIAAKASILGVNRDMLAAHGAVYPGVAEAMALGAAQLYTQPSYDKHVVGLSTTGVAGPGPENSQPAGLAYLGMAIPACIAGPQAAAGMADADYQLSSVELHLQGSREAVRRSCVLQMLRRLFQVVSA